MHIETINPITDPSWERHVAGQAEATAFHTTAWARVLRDTYGFRPRYLVARDNSGGVVAGMPLFEVNGRRLVGLPFSDVCPPLLTEPSIGWELLDQVKLLAGNAAVELRGQASLDLETHGFQKGPSFYYHWLPLTDNITELEKTFDNNVRLCIRQAGRAGVTVRRAFAISDMEAFYQLTLLTRKRLGLLPQPWRFFENIHHHCVSTGVAQLLLAEHEGKVVAGGIYLSYNRTLIHKFGASDPRSLACRPNHAVYRAAMELGIGLGCRWLDMGRCDLADKGLRHFKRSWGAQEQTISYYYYPRVRAGAVAAGPLSRKAMAWAVRLAPLWALRHAGSTLYRRLS